MIPSLSRHLLPPRKHPALGGGTCITKPLSRSKYVIPRFGVVAPKVPEWTP
jgi:hypothetical protein